MSQETGRRSVAAAAVGGCCLLTLGILGGCAGMGQPRVVEPAEELVWPAPPETPRIKYIGELSKPSDVDKDLAATRKLTQRLLGIKSVDSSILLKPYGVHADGMGRVYVADSATGIVSVFDRNAKDVLLFGEKGQGRLGKAMGVTSDQDGRVYVTDAALHRIVVFDSNGKFLRAIGGKDVLVKPVGIALDESRGRLYVADSYGHQLVAFDLEGQVVFALGKKNTPGEIAAGSRDHAWNRGSRQGEFRYPTNVAVGKDGTIYVMDTMNFRVQVFTPDGEFSFSFGKLGNGFGQFARPKGIAVDSQGHVYISDAGFNNVQIFDTTGRLLLFFGSLGVGRGEFYLPAGIAIDASDRIYVADQYNHRIQIFQFLREEESGEV